MRDSESLEGDEWTTYVVLARIQATEYRIVYGWRQCAASHDAVSLVQPGRTGGMFLGQQLTPSRKIMVDKSLLLTR